MAQHHNAAQNIARRGMAVWSVVCLLRVIRVDSDLLQGYLLPPDSDRIADVSGRPKSANRRHQPDYSITYWRGPSRWCLIPPGANAPRTPQRAPAGMPSHLAFSNSGHADTSISCPERSASEG